MNGKFVNSDAIPGDSTSESSITGLSIDECKLICNDLEFCNSIQYNAGLRSDGSNSKCDITSATVSGTGLLEDTSYVNQNESGTKIFQKSDTKSYQEIEAARVAEQQQYFAEQQAMMAAWTGGR